MIFHPPTTHPSIHLSLCICAWKTMVLPWLHNLRLVVFLFLILFCIAWIYKIESYVIFIKTIRSLFLRENLMWLISLLKKTQRKFDQTNPKWGNKSKGKLVSRGNQSFKTSARKHSHELEKDEIDRFWLVTRATHPWMGDNALHSTVPKPTVLCKSLCQDQ